MTLRFIEDVRFGRVVDPSSTARGEPAERLDDALAVYPNPATDRGRFDRPVDFQLYDLLGRRVLQGERARQADVSSLPRGTYLLRTAGNHPATVVVR